uniref:DUF4408 domain-containing protein n=1 Tax=Fagus sylvatica TaxID=28930 RepID=A0A2N9I989_FAGSY
MASNNWMLSLKLVLISTGVVTMAVALKVSVPVVWDFVLCEIPSIWTFLLTWLRPPYLYIVINCIIISIVASSKLHPRNEDPSPEMISHALHSPVPAVVKVSDDRVVYDNGVVLSGGLGYVVNNYDAVETVKKVIGDDDDDVDVVVKRPLQRKDSLEVSFLSNENEKPPFSARFSHRKNVKASPEGGKALRVSKPKQKETFENTWKTITEGRSMPLTRHLKKSDTWDSHLRRNPTPPMDENDTTTTPPTQKMKKSETFGDNRSNTNNSSLSPSPGSGRLRKEPSLSQDDLNRRVEAFINKFNEEMRLQRQESLNQYQEMIRRGGH